MIHSKNVQKNRPAFGRSAARRRLLRRAVQKEERAVNAPKIAVTARGARAVRDNALVHSRRLRRSALQVAGATAAAQVDAARAALRRRLRSANGVTDSQFVGGQVPYRPALREVQESLLADRQSQARLLRQRRAAGFCTLRSDPIRWQVEENAFGERSWLGDIAGQQGYWLVIVPETDDEGAVREDRLYINVETVFTPGGRRADRQLAVWLPDGVTAQRAALRLLARAGGSLECLYRDGPGGPVAGLPAAG